MTVLRDMVAVELAEGLAGPTAGLLLAEAGARVVKVETPGGDRARRWGPPFLGEESAVFLALNRGKESLALDPAHPRGRSVLERLLAEADVVLVDGDPDGPWAEWAGQERSGGQVWCILPPFRPDGPWADRPGAEGVFQALAEVPRSLGRPGEPPIRLGADVAETSAGFLAYLGVLGALYHRARSGQGQRVVVPRVGGILLMRTILWTALSRPDDWFGVHCDHYAYPPEQGVRVGDGKAIYFILRRSTEDLFDRLVLALGMEWVVADPRFADGGRQAVGIGRYAHEVKPIWESAFQNRTTEEVIALIREHGGEASPIQDYPELFAHPQVSALGIVEEVETPAGPFRCIGRPWALEGLPPTRLGRAPRLGEHTRAVLARLGYTPAEVEALVREGAVAGGA